MRSVDLNESRFPPSVPLRVRFTTAMGRRWRLLLVLLVGGSVLAVFLARTAARGDPPPIVVGAEQPDDTRKNKVRGTSEILVRVRVHVVDAQDQPVLRARVMLAPTVAVMETEEVIQSIREAIQDRLDRGWRAWTCAIGTTDQGGMVDLEYTRLIDSDMPLSTEANSSSAREFPFGAFVRIDAEVCGTVFGELEGAQNVRYGRIAAPTVLDVAEAEFVVRCTRGAARAERPGTKDPDQVTGLDIERKARDADGTR